MNTCYLSCRRESSGISSLSAMNKTIKSPFLSKKSPNQAIRDQEEAEKAEARARGEEKEDRPVSAINPLRQVHLPNKSFRIVMNYA